jgi:gamma-glutamylaminecyclotransferase
MSKPKTEKDAKHHVHVFVYGTLKQNLGNYSLLTAANAEFIGYDTITGPFTMVTAGGYPIVCHNPDVTHEVYGQIFRIAPEHLDSLDGLEGHPRWYKREKLRTDIHDLRAWMYCQPQDVIRRYDVVPQNMWRVRPDEADFWKERGVEFPVADAA